MYCNKQTLYHKKTKELVSLLPRIEGNQFNWELGQHEDKTLVINEKGIEKLVDIFEYTHFVDWAGRPASRTDKKPKNKFVDETLKIYLVDSKTREKKRIAFFERWKKENLQRLSKGQMNASVKIKTGKNSYTYKVAFKRGWFADGSICHEFQNWFIKQMKCKYLYTKEMFGKTVRCLPYFSYKNKTYLIDNHDIVEINLK